MPIRRAITSALQLARPVPADGGQARIRIVKTYKDRRVIAAKATRSFLIGPLGIRRNAVVLPSGYRLTECNVPSQIMREPDGRIRISFMHQAPGQAALMLKATRGAATGDSAKSRALTDASSWEPPPAQGSTERDRLSERAHVGPRYYLFPERSGDARLQSFA